MFFHLSLDEEIELHPQFFGPRMRQTLEEKLKKTVRPHAPRSGLLLLLCRLGACPMHACCQWQASLTFWPAQVEGTCSGKHGFIICVTELHDVQHVRAAASALCRTHWCLGRDDWHFASVSEMLPCRALQCLCSGRAS